MNTGEKLGILLLLIILGGLLAFYFATSPAAPEEPEEPKPGSAWRSTDVHTRDDNPFKNLGSNALIFVAIVLVFIIGYGAIRLYWGEERG